MADPTVRPAEAAAMDESTMRLQRRGISPTIDFVMYWLFVKWIGIGVKAYCHCADRRVDETLVLLAESMTGVRRVARRPHPVHLSAYD